MSERVSEVGAVNAEIEYWHNGESSGSLFIFAHGAGAPADSDFMNFMAEAIADEGVEVIRFEFPYMRERRSTGQKRPPNSATILESCWSHVFHEFREDFPNQRIFIGGKSMGGRVAAQMAEILKPEGVVCMGYPFHAPGKKGNIKGKCLEATTTPTLILQGERDPFGTRSEVSEFALSRAVQVDFLPDGDHSFKPRKKSGVTESENWTQAVHKVSRFINLK